MTWDHPILGLAALALVLDAPKLPAQDIGGAEPIMIGTSYTASALGSERRVNVVLPADYSAQESDYPVVMVLDAGLDQDFFLTLGMLRWNRMWDRSAPAIYVGIETVDRQRELLPPTTDAAERQRYPTAGQSRAFRDWLADSVLPFIRAAYRTDGRAFLLGESAAGHFVVETWATRPALFDGYAAISPSLQWDAQALSRMVAGEPVTAARPPLFVSLANEGGPTEEGVLRLVDATASPLCFADRRDRLVHANTLHGLFPEALQYLLPTEADWLDEYGLTLACATSRGPAPSSAARP